MRDQAVRRSGYALIAGFIEYDCELAQPDGCSDDISNANTTEDSDARIKAGLRPTPRYPLDVRQPLVAGQASGSFRVLFDVSGHVVAVQTVHSTGNSSLDKAAVSTLREWRSEGWTGMERRRADYFEP